MRDTGLVVRQKTYKLKLTAHGHATGLQEANTSRETGEGSRQLFIIFCTGERLLHDSEPCWNTGGVSIINGRSM